jgi:uncharacterized protein (DUF1501 family)
MTTRDSRRTPSQTSPQPGPATRREFLRWSGRFAGLGAAAPFALQLAALGSAAASGRAAAQAGDDYKALVCVFLYGGNDNGNTLIPYDSATYAQYQALRPSLARARADLLPLSVASNLGGRQLALPPELQPVHALFEAGRAAWVANVGPLLRPTNRTQFEARSVPLPPKLFSHNDQQSVWQASVPEGAQEGWGGRIADLLATRNTRSTFTSLSVAGQAVWSAGRSVLQYQVGPGGATQVAPLGRANLFGSGTAPELLRRLVSEPRPHLLELDHTRLMTRALAANAELRDALAAVPDLQTVFPTDNALAAQLRMAARIVSARAALGARRQVFFVALGGWDHHAFLSNSHPPLLARLASALAAFDAALGELNVRDRVTTFTASDFGRTLLANGDGSDHGWGSHHLVMGGAVRGRDVVGSFPALTPGHAQDAGQGRLIPTTSVDQYAASFGRWMGLSDTELADVLPNLRQFSPATLPLFL